MKNKNGFTLVELLAVVVVLAITFMFVIPRMVTLINEGEDTNAKMIEEKIIDAAREYAYNQDKTFLTTFISEGDSKIITKDSLLNASLIDEKDIESLEGFSGVKVELLAGDEFKYTVMYE